MATEVYNPTIVEHGGSWSTSKRSSRNHHSQQTAPHHSHHHLMVNCLFNLENGHFLNDNLGTTSPPIST